MKKVSRIQAHLCLLGAAIIYGSTFNIAKIAMPDFIPPNAFIVLRITIGGLLFSLLHHFAVKEKIKEKRDYFHLFIAAIFGAFLNQYVFFEGLSRTSPVNAAVIMVSAPIIVLILSAIFLKEQLTLKKIIGISLGVIGALLMIGLNGLVLNSGTMLGDFLVLLNATSYSVYLVLIKPLARKYHPFTIMKWVFLFATPMILPIGFSSLLEVQWQEMNIDVLLSISFVVVCTTFFAYLFNATALQTVNASTTSFYIYFQPLIAGFISVFFFSESLKWTQIVAAILIFMGVFLISKRKD